MNWKRAFTRIELLVVIAVMAILASLLFPAVNNANGKARRATCLNNLKQTNLGVRMYTDDFSDFSPSTPATNPVPSLENFVDWRTNRIESGGISYVMNAADYDPPAGYDYQWSGD